MNPQKCDQCDKPAVVHEVTVKNGVKREIHLCHEHAQEAGVSMPTHQPINQLLTQFVISQGGKGKGKGKAKPQTRTRKRKRCPGCGMTRGFVAMSRGRLRQAWLFNALSPLVYVLAWLYLIGALLGRFTRLRVPAPPRGVRTAAFVAAFLLIAASWALSLLRFYDHLPGGP